MTASKGIRRPPGAPPLEWMVSQSTPEPCHAPGLTGDCLIWQRAKTPDGYGRICIDGKDVVAHRAAYEIANGPVVCWLVMDHLCRRRDCINPDHVEPVTQVENIKRGESPATAAHRSGVCQRGHELTPSGGRMRCKICLAARQREWYERKRVEEGRPAGEQRASNDTRKRSA